MTLKEKLAQAQANVPKVYDAGVFDSGFAVGYTEGIDKGQSLFGFPNEVTGTGVVTLDYVNENEHNVEVKLSSDTVTDFSGREVKTCGKNLFNVEYAKNKDNWVAGAYYSMPLPYLKVGHTYTIGMTENNMYRDYKTEYNPHFAMYISTTPSTASGKGIGNAGTTAYSATEYQITITENKLYYMNLAFGKYGFENGIDIVFNELFKDFQIEINATKTTYEPYTEKTYTANADGTVDGITSIAPTMNIIYEGVDISAKYYCTPSVEYDRFWDNFQKYGKRTSYRGAFTDYGFSWNDTIYNPKYPITLEVSSNGGYNVFQNSDNITDTKVDIICLDGVALNGAFQSADKLQTIRKLVVNENVTYTSTFQSSANIKNILFEGVIGTSINFQWSTLLSVESAKNIIQCLANYKGTDKDLVNTVTFHANVWDALESEGNTSPNGNTWREYVTDKGWIDA